jgi:hypothetical protein
MGTHTAEATTIDVPSALGEIASLFKSVEIIVAALLAIGTAIGAFWTDVPDELAIGILCMAGLMFLTVIFAKVVMPSIEARRRRQIIAIPEEQFKSPTTFRLRPYDEADHAGFDRPDRAHHEAVRWLQTAAEPFLYFTGVSGSGKSSLLHAWIVPELAAANPPIRTIVVRSYADPIAQLTGALTKPGAIWDKRPRSADSLRELLERAVERVRPARLLIAIDQFEECLILQDVAVRTRLTGLFREFREKPIQGLTFLLTLRDDYFDFDQLRALGLPEVRSDDNWFKLNALSRGDAREVFDRQLKIDAQLREKVLDEASEVDDLPGLVRPITLNMLGLVLQRFRGGALKDTAPGRLIQDYLRGAMAKPGIDQIAPRLLAKMITDKGTKCPADEPSLASATGSPQGFVRKALYLLAEDGVVRELEPERKVWEISHDFVARQLGQIIPRLRPSGWRRVQVALAPVALASWLILLTALVVSGPELMARYARGVLSDEGVRTPWIQELGGYAVDFSFAHRDGVFDRTNQWLRWLHPIKSVSISNDGNLTDLSPLLRVTKSDEITELTISGNANLKVIHLLPRLRNLAQLNISDNDSLMEVEDLSTLSKLVSLEVARNKELQKINGLSGLNGLTTLVISYNETLESIQVPAELQSGAQVVLEGYWDHETFQSLLEWWNRINPSGQGSVLNFTDVSEDLYCPPVIPGCERTLCEEICEGGKPKLPR